MRVAFVLCIVILHLWLLTATMNAFLGGDDAVIVPAALASLAGLLLNVGLFRYLIRLERSRPGSATARRRMTGGL